MIKIALTKMFAFVFVLFVASSSYAQSATQEQVYELLEIMNTKQQFIDGIAMTMKMQKESGALTMLPEGFVEEFIKRAETDFETELLPKMAESYQNNFSEKELGQLIKFYSTDVGKMLLNKMPAVQAESAQVGMEWGQQLGMELAQKLMNKE